MSSIYQTGEYLHSNRTWHVEDSPWKARQIRNILQRNGLKPKKVAEIGCGAGAILEELAGSEDFRETDFYGYDVSPQAIELARPRSTARISFFNSDLLLPANSEFFDALLVIDVFEHVPDYMGFLEKCRVKAEYKVYHIPLDIHVSSVLRAGFLKARQSVGHLHYFSEETALATLRDTGHEIIDCFFTNGAIDLLKTHPNRRTQLANIPRRLLAVFSPSLAARLLGGYSLLVLAK